MSKISVTLDATKLRNLVTQRSYKNKDGIDIQLQEVKFELIPVRPENVKVVFENEERRFEKTHFACAIKKTKEEETVYIGEGFSTVWKNTNNVEVHNAEIISPVVQDDLPF